VRARGLLAPDASGGPRPTTRGTVTFLATAFAWSWAWWSWPILSATDGDAVDVARVLGRFGPLVAALVVTGGAGGIQGVTAWIHQLRRWRAPARLWCVALFGPPGVVVAALVASAAAGEDLGSFNDPRSAYLVVPAFLAILVLGGPLGEEPGWRGFALDRLQSRLGPVVATLFLGIAWGLWHLPLFLDPAAPQHGLPLITYLGQTLTTAFVYTWLWNRTHSMALVLVLHTSTNLAAGVFPLLVPDARSHLPFTVAVVIAATIAIALTMATHGRLGWTPVTADTR
jgi:uncharacterized protein